MLPSSSSASPISATIRPSGAVAAPSHGPSRSPAPARRTASAPRRGRPSRSRNRRRRCPWCARDSSARPCSRGNSPASRGSGCPIRYWMAWKIGEACGFTATRSCGCSTREVERRHDRRQRGRRGLVAADLHAVAAVAQMVGVVDRPGGEPEDLLLELGENRQARIGHRCHSSGVRRCQSCMVRAAMAAKHRWRTRFQDWRFPLRLAKERAQNARSQTRRHRPAPAAGAAGRRPHEHPGSGRPRRPVAHRPARGGSGCWRRRA